MDITTLVNLDEYSSSENFIGYCERIKFLDDNITNKLIDTFFNEFLYDVQKKQLFSSLYLLTSFDDLKKDYELSIELINNYFLPLINEGWVEHIDYNKLFDNCSLIECENKLDDIKNNLKCYDLTSNSNYLIRNVCYLIMQTGGISGHCFFYIKESGLVIYPHDDGGFGVISEANSHSIIAAKKFLKSFEGIEDTAVVLKDQ